MSTYKDKIITYLLTPLSWIYGGVTWVRNKLFDTGIFREAQFDIPILCIGNITVGGTGKTPHVEYVANALGSDYRIAVLSRGYKRKTKGFVLANSKSTPEQIGDEPMQIYQKLGSFVKVAVCENRREGISELMRNFPDLDLIILDDAFQHRWVRPKVSVLLTDYSRPFYHDKMLPLGRLRESAHAATRADVVIVTKCPEEMTPLQYRLIRKELDLMAFQKCFFSRYRYGQLQPVFPDEAKYAVSLGALTARDSVLLLTGIAHPRYFVRHFKQYPFAVKVDHFPDHHDFTRKDIAEIKARFKRLKGERKIIVTTEKDAVRLSYNPYFPRELKPFIFYIPVTVNAEVNPDGGELISTLRGLIKA